jgi:sortase A
MILLVALAGLTLAFAPPMSQLASTGAPDNPEGTSGDTTRGLATTEQITKGSTQDEPDTLETTARAQKTPTADEYEGEAADESTEIGPATADANDSGGTGAASAEPSETSFGADEGAGDGSGGGEATASQKESEPRQDSQEQSAEETQEKAQTDAPQKNAPQKEQEPQQEQQQEQQTDQGGNSLPDEQEASAPPAPSDKTMSLSVPRLAQVQGDTVLNSDAPGTMARAAMKLPSTGFPWQEGANTYIAGHRIGWQGTESRYQFYNLPAMRNGDAVYLTDANGTTYEYRVTEKFAVSPSENWVTEPVAGRDMITLQTCTDSVDPSTWWDITPKLMQAGPDTGRLVVRADKVATYPA